MCFFKGLFDVAQNIPGAEDAFVFNQDLRQDAVTGSEDFHHLFVDLAFTEDLIPGDPSPGGYVPVQNALVGGQVHRLFHAGAVRTVGLGHQAGRDGDGRPFRGVGLRRGLGIEGAAVFQTLGVFVVVAAENLVMDAQMQPQLGVGKVHGFSGGQKGCPLAAAGAAVLRQVQQGFGRGLIA